MYWCKWQVYFWLVIAILFALSSCQMEEEKQAFYFDSAQYAKEEVAYLQGKVSEVNKDVSINGQNEALLNVTIDSAAFNEMTLLLSQANINQAKFQREYVLDTFWMLDPITQENIEVVNYTTQNPKLKLRWMQVYSNGSIKVLLSNSNLLFSYEKELFYDKDKSFSVISWQKTLGQDTLKLYNKTTFL